MCYTALHGKAPLYDTIFPPAYGAGAVESHRAREGAAVFTPPCTLLYGQEI